MTFSTHQIPHALATILSLWIAGVVWRRRPAPGAMAFAGASLAIGVWSATNALEWGSPNLDVMRAWVRVQFVAIAALPVFWFIFAMRFSARQGWVEGRAAWLLWVVPVVTVGLVWTHNHHDLMLRPIVYDDTVAYPGVRHSYGPWFWIHTLYSYTLLGVGTVTLLASLARVPGIYRWQLATVCCAAAVPIAGNVAYVFGFSPVPGLDLTPPLFALTGSLVGWSLLRWRFLDLVPAARAVVVECMADGVLVVDARGRVVDLNPAAQAITGWAVADALGHPLADLFSTTAGWLARPDEADANTAELACFGGDGRGCFYEVRATPLHGVRGQETGRLVLLRDVTERRRADEERDQLIAKLQEAVSSIKTLSGLIPICAACKKVRDDQGYWQQVEEYVSAHAEVEFSHGLCPDCMAKLYPDAAPSDGRGVDDAESGATDDTP